MHSLGIFGFPRRIFDYSIIFFRFHWFNSFGIIGILLSFLFFILSLIIDPKHNPLLTLLLLNW
jgi:heme/copper-type cytochrome/quinol oxidase subunit 1